MTRPTCVLALATAVLAIGCVDDTVRRSSDRPDAGTVDAAADAACTKSMFFADVDNDGHGDPSSIVMACEQPPSTAKMNDDCNDHDQSIHPGATDVCDAVDNDCSPATLETCPTGCTAVRRPAPDNAHVYLFCTGALNWPNARNACTAAGMKLVEIDDAAENAFVVTEATTRLNLNGAPIHIGANDSVQVGSWQWDGGDVFWQGNQNGAPVNNKFAAWRGGQEPNNSDRCGELRSDSAWYDNGCGDNQRYVCRN